MIIQHNMSAMNSNRQLGVTGSKLAKSTEKLSSGYRINRSADDAAGLAISEKMRGQIRGLTQASTNAEDGISLIQTAEGALQESQNIIQRMRELAVQAANDTNTDDDRIQIQQEIQQLTIEVDRIATSTEFNTKKLLDGTQQGSQSYRSGDVRAEGSFVNGNVSLEPLSSDVSGLVGIDDVVRIEFRRDMTEDWDDSSIANSETPQDEIADKSYKVTSLNGADLNVTVTSDGQIIIEDASFSEKGVEADAEPDSPLEIQINSSESIKAGDVITISLKNMEVSKAAADGQEGLRLQIGANSGQEVVLGIRSMKSRDLGIVQTQGDDIGAALDVTTQGKASICIEAYDKALQRVSAERARLGAMENRLEHSVANLDSSAENLQAAESRIRDVDMASEMAEYSKSNILMQAGQSMLAQANQMTQGVLNLLRQ